MSFETVIKKLKPFSEIVISQGKNGAKYKIAQLITQFELFEELQQFKNEIEKVMAKIHHNKKKIEKIRDNIQTTDDADQNLKEVSDLIDSTNILFEDLNKHEACTLKEISYLDNQFTRVVEALEITRDGCLLGVLGYGLIEGFPSLSGKETHACWACTLTRRVQVPLPT